MRARLVTLILAAGVSLGGCAYGGGLGGLSVGTSYGDPYGYGGRYGSPYDGQYGYGSPYGSPYGYGGYRSPYGHGGGFGYDPFNRYNPYYRSPYYSSPFGWYGGYYYPGTGYYVYDRERRRRPLTEQLRQYWERQRAEAARTKSTGGSAMTQSRTRLEPNWSGFNRETETRSRSSLAGEIGSRARARTESRQVERRTTTKSTRSPSTSNDLRTTIRRRLRDSND